MSSIHRVWLFSSKTIPRQNNGAKACLLASSSSSSSLSSSNLIWEQTSNFSTSSVARKVHRMFIKNHHFCSPLKLGKFNNEQNNCSFWNQTIGKRFASASIEQSAETSTSSSSPDWMGFMSLVQNTNDEAKSTPNGPFDTSKNAMDIRAQVKLQTLEDVKETANQSKNAYDANSNHGDSDARKELFQKWTQNEAQLARAYSQAIKYVARNTKQINSAKHAQQLLQEMLQRMGITDETKSDKPFLLNKKRMSRMIQSPPTNDNNDQTIDIPPLLFIPENTISRRDFHNVLHSWASSKARRKGEYAEFLLMRMVELSYWYPDHLDVKPNSQTFALVVKCHAGSTHNESLERILKLHEIHNSFTERGVPGFIQDDPFFLMHSLKAIKNYRKADDLKHAQEWFHRLHAFVANPSQNLFHYYSNYNDQETTKKIDLTGTYTAIIRDYAKLRGQAGAAESARDVLDKMHELSEIQRTSTNDEYIAEMTIKSNAYDLVLGSYSDSKDSKVNANALHIFDRMFRSWTHRNHDEEYAGNIPSPTESSFEYCFKSLRNFDDLDEVKSTSKRLLNDFETMMCEQSEGTKGNFFPDEVKVYNACLELYTNAFSKEPNIGLELVKDILQRMNVSSVEPDVTTHSLTLKAYSMASESIDEANKIFLLLQREELLEKTKMTDACYYHMMKCVAKFEKDAEEREKRFIELFSETCNKGLVSANVLRAFKSNVSEKVFLNKVGSGRLADKWIQNVTSPKAIYSDLSKGGAGKNARRKGKSTSGWAMKKQKEIEEKKTRKARKIISFESRRKIN